MTVTDTPPETRTPDPPAEPTATGPSTRAVVTAFTGIIGTAAAVLVFAAGGWIALALAGAASAGGLAVASRVRNPSNRTRPGLLTTLIGRPRRTRTTRTSTKRSGVPGIGTGRRTGNGTGRAGNGRALPKLPAVTAKGRAKRASAAGTGKPLGRSAATRPVARTAKKAAAKRAPGTGPGRGRSSTPTKTGAKATRKPLVPTRGATPAKKATASRPRLATAKKPASRPAGTGRRALPKVSNGGRGATILPFKRPGKKAASRPSSGTSTAKKTTARRGVTKPGMKLPGMSHRPGAGRRSVLRRTTGGKRIGTRRTGGRVTQRARRLGTPRLRRVQRGPAATVPNRTPRRTRPATHTPTKRLVRTAMRLPRRNGWKISRPSKVEQRKARRTLGLRRRLAGRRMLGRVARSPRWLWNHRPGWLWPAIPMPLSRDLLRPNTPEPKLSLPAIDSRRVKHRTPYPQLTGRRAGSTPKEHRTMSNPIEAVTEAFGQLGQFDPENATAMADFLANLGHMHTEMSSQFGALINQWQGEKPIDPSVLEAMQTLTTIYAGAADIADEVHSTFRSAHERDLARLEEPRAGEADWDTVNNQ